MSWPKVLITQELTFKLQCIKSVNKEKLPIHIMQIKSTTPLFQIILVSPSLESSYKKCYITFSIFRITHQVLLTLLKYLQFCSWYCIVYYYYKSRQANLIVNICCCLVAQSCPTFCDSTDCTSPGSPSMEFSRQEYWRVAIFFFRQLISRFIS